MPGEKCSMLQTNRSQQARLAVHVLIARICNLYISYRGLVLADAPVFLLLHRFPTSQNMFRNLTPGLAGSFRLIAPD